MILITGASGKTGRTLIETLTKKGAGVRALVHREASEQVVREAGATEVVIGDLLDEKALEVAFSGAYSVYHICPNMHPEEEKIGALVIEAAKKANVEKFVYHSVLHPQVEDMPHHWGKLRVEEQLFKSGLAYTILQPAAYMQNVLGYWNAMMNDGIYAIPYRTSSKSSMVDLHDVAEAAARVLLENGHACAIYELSGKDALSADEVADIVSQHTGKTIRAVASDRAEWEAAMLSRGMPIYAIDTLLKMFIYYESYDFIGNSHVLHWLLGREPHRFNDFIAQMVEG